VKSSGKRSFSPLRDKEVPLNQQSTHHSLLQTALTPLLYWYERECRSLPWRSDPTPYHVWVSEIMLQQTRVEAVKPYYLRFLDACPTPKALSMIEDNALMKLWEGLGYYSRARNLKKAATIIVREHGGELPADYDALLALPGIGPYTAGAISSIAFGLPVPAVDGNVLRLITRLLAMEDDISLPATKATITDLLSKIYPSDPGEISMTTQALMELGALICLPNGAPKCEECPLGGLCKARQLGLTDRIPVKPIRRARRIEQMTVFLLRYDGRYALRRRPENGLLGGLYEPMHLPGHLAPDALCSLFELSAPPIPLPAARHVFTHIEWDMIGYELCLCAPLSDMLFLTPNEIRRDYAVATAFKPFLSHLSNDSSSQGGTK